MAYIRCKLKSMLLQSTVDVGLYFPTDLPPEVGNTAKGVITLLHGYSNDCDDWMYMSAACRYAADNGLVLVAPSVGNSFYMDSQAGRWFTFVTEEMPQLLGKIFRLPQGREHNFIAGLSMGGYGAMLMALRRPDLYGAAASFSGALDINRYVDDKHAKMLFADGNVPAEYDLFALAQKAADEKTALPQLLLTCGREDNSYWDIHEQNGLFAAHCRALGLPIEAVQWTGIHEWNFWDRSLIRAIGFFLGTQYNDTRLEFWRAPEEAL